MFYSLTVIEQWDAAKLHNGIQGEALKNATAVRTLAKLFK